MKKRVHLLLIGLFVWVAIAVAQDVSGLTNAFRKGSAQEMSPFLGDKVEYIYMGTSRSYNKMMAQQAISGFFMANKVSSFTVNHQGNRGESGFIVGTLQTTGGNYRVNCFFKKVDSQYLIHQIRIDRSNE